MAVAAFRRFASKKNRERQTSDSALSEVSEVILRRTRRAGETVSMRFVSELCRPWGEMRDDGPEGRGGVRGGSISRDSPSLSRERER